MSTGPGAGERMPATYERLEPAKVAATLDRLHHRVAERLPGRRLADVVLEVRQVVEQIEREQAGRAGWVTVLRRTSQVLSALLAVVVVIGIGTAVSQGARVLASIPTFDWLSIVESGVNDAVFAGIAIYFLLSLPDRVQRRRLLASLYRLRSLAHIVDMHQMSKDPESAGSDDGAVDVLSVPDLARYYGYCSELLSLTSKAAALCGEGTADAVVLDTVSEIESLTTGMSRKIWQKISLLTPGRLVD